MRTASDCNSALSRFFRSSIRKKSVTDRDIVAGGCLECLMRRWIIRYERDSGKQSAGAMTGRWGGGGGSRLSLADGLPNNTPLPLMRRAGASNRWLRLFINLFPSRSQILPAFLPRTGLLDMQNICRLVVLVDLFGAVCFKIIARRHQTL